MCSEGRTQVRMIDEEGCAGTSPMMRRMRVLLVEDSERLRRTLEMGLRREGFGVDAVGEGPEGLSYARNNPYDVVVLDIMLPGLDGLSVLRQLRAEGSDTHILLLTARDTVEDRVVGLEAGADDYLVKPFAFDELVARLRALTRRKYGRKNPTLALGGVEVDRAAREARAAGEVLELSPREYALLEFLGVRAGEVVSREEIEDALYDEHTLPSSNAVDSAVCRLRAKLDPLDGAPQIITRRGHGYLLQTRDA